MNVEGIDIKGFMHISSLQSYIRTRKTKYPQGILSSKSELSQGEVVSLLGLLSSSEVLLSLAKGSSEGSSSLESQVNGIVFLSLKGFSDSFSVSLVDNSQVFSDGLSDNLEIGLYTVDQEERRKGVNFFISKRVLKTESLERKFAIARAKDMMRRPEIEKEKVVLKGKGNIHNTYSDLAELSGGTTSNLEGSEVVEFLLVFFQTLEQFFIAGVSKLENSELLVSHFSPLLIMIIV